VAKIILDYAEACFERIPIAAFRAQGRLHYLSAITRRIRPFRNATSQM